MIIGDGDVATAIEDRDDLLFFASGVSNSQCTDEAEYKRELDLLLQQPRDAHIVYFSSLSIFYSKSRYARHKLAMECLVQKEFKHSTIIRLGNISWGKNPNTLVNYLKAHPKAEIQDVFRYLIGIDEFLHWMQLIPPWSCEMNLPGEVLKVAEIKELIDKEEL